MLLIKGELNTFTGRTKWENKETEIDIKPITSKIRKFSKKTIYYTNIYYYGKQSKMNPLSQGDTIQVVYKEENKEKGAN